MTALPPLTALAPLLLLGVAALSLSTPGHRPGALPKLAEGATLGALAELPLKATVSTAWVSV